jgi:hypothetical protein
MPEGSDDGRVEKNVLYERTHEWKGSPLWSPWWLIAKGATDHFEVFTLDGGSILPVFSDEDEAEMYLWFERAREEGCDDRQHGPPGRRQARHPGARSYPRVSCKGGPGRSS